MPLPPPYWWGLLFRWCESPNSPAHLQAQGVRGVEGSAASQLLRLPKGVRGVGRLLAVGWLAGRQAVHTKQMSSCGQEGGQKAALLTCAERAPVKDRVRTQGHSPPAACSPTAVSTAAAASTGSLRSTGALRPACSMRCSPRPALCFLRATAAPSRTSARPSPGPPALYARPHQAATPTSRVAGAALAAAAPCWAHWRCCWCCCRCWCWCWWCCSLLQGEPGRGG